MTQEMALRTYVGIEARMKNEMRSPYILLNSLRKIVKSPSFMQYERNKYALVHETYRGIFDKSFHLKSGCNLEHSHKPFIMEEKSQEPFYCYPRLEDN